MRTLIFGAKGQLGRDLCRVFAKEGEARGLDLPEADITDEVSLQPLVESFAPDIIINAAAYTDVEAAEENLEKAFLVNEVGARNVAEIGDSLRIPVVYYSTDFVFDGSKEGPYLPEDPTCPINVYGSSKAAGEKAVARACPRHFIVRTAWLYGPGGNNFVEKILRAAQEKPKLRVVDDERGCPTHTLALARATLALAQTRAYGAYHTVNVGACSRYEQTQAILRLAGLDTPIEPCPASEYPMRAKRPKEVILNVDKFVETTGHALPPWQSALEEYMQRRENSA